jgi:hypothetical protein
MKPLQFSRGVRLRACFSSADEHPSPEQIEHFVLSMKLAAVEPIVLPMVIAAQNKGLWQGFAMGVICSVAVFILTKIFS